MEYIKCKCKVPKFLSDLDIFGISYIFRVDNKEKHQTAFGGIMTCLCLSLSIYFFFFKFIDFLKNEDIQIQYLNKFDKDAIKTGTDNFHVSLVFKFYDEKTKKTINVKGTEYEKYFSYEMLHILRFRNGTKITDKIEEINCTDIDLSYNFPPEETYDFLNDHICFDLPETELYGQFSDKSMVYYQANFNINKNFLSNSTLFNEVKDVILEKNFEVNVYYSTKKIDVTNFKNPAIKRIDTLSYNYLSWYNTESVNYFFNEIIYTSDLDSMFNKRKSQSFLKFSFYDKIVAPTKNRQPQESSLIKYYIRPEVKKEEIIVTPKKVPDFISDVLAIILLIFEFFQFIVPLFNDFQGKQSIIAKICKIDENLKNLNNSQILDLVKFIDDDEKNKLNKYNKDNNNYKYLKDNDNDNNMNLIIKRIIIMKSILFIKIKFISIVNKI